MTCVINSMLSGLTCYECLTPGMLRYQFLMKNIEQQPSRLMRAYGRIEAEIHSLQSARWGVL